MSGRFKRDHFELKAKASLFWPSELRAKEASTSILPLLLETQDTFINLLRVANARPDAWKDGLRITNGVKANLFLKHLMVLADVGGELLSRLAPQLQSTFPTSVMKYAWNGEMYEYQFKAILQLRRLNNKSLSVDGRSLIKGRDLDEKMEDVIMLVLHGGAAINASLPDIVKERCTIGTLIGQADTLERFVKQRYIMVSRITGGATANTLGQIAQDYVKEMLEQSLPKWHIIRNGTIPGISQNEGVTDISFDIVARSPKGKYTAIEVSFQVTTNSTIERKAGQAKARAELVHTARSKIAYVIDGAGNFERQAALRTICRYSDCTVAFTPEEINVLIAFLKENG
jgi:hypothetical protein